MFFSKDGRESTRQFFTDHDAGFPDTTPEDALAFVESILRTGVLDPYRYTMASKLGTSTFVDQTRMKAMVGELIAAKILHDAGYNITPEIEVTTGHSLDYRADRNDEGYLVEVTRPTRPGRRRAHSPVQAVRETAQTKTAGQLSEHGGGVVLFVDCSSFHDDEWAQVRGEKPGVRHKPAVIFRTRPDGHIEGYRKGRVPLDLDGVIEWV